MISYPTPIVLNSSRMLAKRSHRAVSHCCLSKYKVSALIPVRQVLIPSITPRGIRLVTGRLTHYVNTASQVSDRVMMSWLRNLADGLPNVFVRLESVHGPAGVLGAAVLVRIGAPEH